MLVITLYLSILFLLLLKLNIYNGIFITIKLKSAVTREEIIMAMYQTPEEMYKKRKIKRNILYVSLIILAIGLVLGLQFLLYSM